MGEEIDELGDESRIRGNGQSRSWTLCQEFGGEDADIEEVGGDRECQR